MDLCIYNLNIKKIQQQKLDQVEVLSAHSGYNIPHNLL
jgi:hypothetical protein